MTRGRGAARPAGVGVRRRAGLRGLPAVRHRGRDQLPARAARPAAAAARAGGRDGLPVLDRHRRARARAARLAALRLRAGRGVRRRRPSGSSTPGRSTSCSPGAPPADARPMPDVRAANWCGRALAWRMTHDGTVYDGRRTAVPASGSPPDIDWLDSKHSFSFGHHYDPRTPTSGCCSSTTTTSSRRAPASRRTRTATWRSSPGCSTVAWCTRTPQGHNGVIYPGLAQRMSAGTGILHSEKNDALAADGRRPEQTATRCTSCRCGCPGRGRIEPGYEQLDIADAELRGRPRLVAWRWTCRARAAIRIRQQDAALFAARLAPGRVGGRCRPRRTCTCTSPAARSTWRVRAALDDRRRRPHHRGGRPAGDRRRRSGRGPRLGDARRPLT